MGPTDGEPHDGLAAGELPDVDEPFHIVDKGLGAKPLDVDPGNAAGWVAVPAHGNPDDG